MDYTFGPADLLIPDPARIPSFTKWAVIACDQFTSQPDYWNNVRRIISSSYSTGWLILPEAELDMRDAAFIDCIHARMAEYREQEIYKEYPDSLVYVERRQSNGTLRRGIVGCIDLENYDYSEHSSSRIRATEKTIEKRIPPRVAVRDGAPTELSHVILYADDNSDSLLGPITAGKYRLPMLYDFDLMLGGGHITGWLVQGAALERFETALEAYYKRQDEKALAGGAAPIYFTVADGNHSLAAAKTCYEKSKKTTGRRDPRLRMAMVELENLHDASQQILPIHRLIKGVDPKDFISETSKVSAAHFEDSDAGRDIPAGSGIRVPWFSAKGSGFLTVIASTPAEAIVNIQNFIDRYLESAGGTVDYIHGDITLKKLAREENTVGLFMPPIEKDNFFRHIMNFGVYPRKTFSVGTATDKRYYLEVRDLV